MQRFPAHGHSLAELLVALAIVALLTVAGAGGWRTLQARLKLASGASLLRGALAEGRLAALSRGESVLLRLDPAGRGFVLVARGEHGDEELRRGALPAGLVATANRPAVTYYPWPRAASPVTVTLCAGGRALDLIVSQAGRPRTEDAGRC